MYSVWVPPTFNSSFCGCPGLSQWPTSVTLGLAALYLSYHLGPLTHWALQSFFQSYVAAVCLWYLGRALVVVAWIWTVNRLSAKMLWLMAWAGGNDFISYWAERDCPHSVEKKGLQKRRKWPYGGRALYLYVLTCADFTLFLPSLLYSAQIHRITLWELHVWVSVLTVCLFYLSLFILVVCH